MTPTMCPPLKGLPLESVNRSSTNDMKKITCFFIEINIFFSINSICNTTMKDMILMAKEQLSESYKWDDGGYVVKQQRLIGSSFDSDKEWLQYLWFLPHLDCVDTALSLFSYLLAYTHISFTIFYSWLMPPCLY